MLQQIKTELARVSAEDVDVRLDGDFEPETGTLVKVQLDEAYWHLLPENFLELLKELPDGAGAEGVRRAIESRGSFVWHGPSPEGSRDTSQ